MTIFQTTVHGIPCQCKVLAHYPYIPMRIVGSGFGDAYPPEEEEFEFEILDRKGRQAPWLEKYLSAKDNDRLLDEFHLVTSRRLMNQ